MVSILPIIVAASTAFVSSLWVFPKVLRIAKSRNLVDNPDERKLQKEPVPVLGGVAVAFGMIVGIQVGIAFSTLFNIALYVPTFSVMTALFIMLYLGAIDDILGLTPMRRFIAEVLVILLLILGNNSCIDSLHGLWGIQNFSWWIAIPLTVFACVGIINAVNMVDGVNGLSSSLCIINNILLGSIFAKSGMLTTGILNFVLAAALVPFLLHNVIGVKSKMFIGDSGTMMMGLLMSYDVIQLLRSDSPASWMQYAEPNLSIVALALAILAVPVGDTLRVMTMRIVHHQSPFSPDKTHLHHILMDYSHSHTLTTLAEVLLSLLIVASWPIACLCHASIDVQFYVVLVVAMITVWGSYAYLTSHRTVRTGLAWRLRALFARLRQGDTAWWQNLQEKIDKY